MRWGEEMVFEWDSKWPMRETDIIAGYKLLSRTNEGNEVLLRHARHEM